MNDLPRSQRFVQALPKEVRGRVVPESLEPLLLRKCAEARTAWVQFSLEEDTFLDFLAQRTPAGTDCVAALEALHGEDLYLVCACLQNDPLALEALDQQVQTAAKSAALQLRAGGTFAEEVQQLLRQKLLVSTPETKAKLLDYAGRGPLGLWLRVAAMRVALNLLEAEKPNKAVAIEAVQALAASGPGPESILERGRYGPEFKQALEEALQLLSTRERNYLRLYFVEGLTVEAIARMEGANKSTVSRWLSKSKETLLCEIRRLLKERLRVTPQELDSVMGLLQSQIDLSLVRVLA